jgi:type II secretory pathway predicted ATPase ExeA
MLASKFGLSDRAAQSKTVLLRELELLLRARLDAGETSVLMVDDAQSLPLELLEELRLLTNMEADDVKLLSVVLVGQPELARRIEDASMSQLKQRIALWCELKPLSGQETVSYVLDRIRRAGGTAREIFTIEAVQTIHQAARGVPRIVNVLADNALISGLALNQRPVTRDIVLSVCRDFRLDVRAEATAADAGSPGVPRMEMPRREPVVSVRVPLDNAEPFAEIEGPARRRFAPAGGDA